MKTVTVRFVLEIWTNITDLTDFTGMFHGV